MSERSIQELFFPSQGPSTSTTASVSRRQRNGDNNNQSFTIRSYTKRAHVEAKDEDNDCFMASKRKKTDFPQDVTPSADEAPVHIDVGGVIYTTTLKTLNKYPNSKLGKMFSGKIPLTVDRMKQHYFIDRDGNMFRHVLNFLRNDDLLLPTSFTSFDLLFREATYYELEAMALKIKHIEELSYARNRVLHCCERCRR